MDLFIKKNKIYVHIHRENVLIIVQENILRGIVIQQNIRQKASRDIKQFISPNKRCFFKITNYQLEHG